MMKAEITLLGELQITAETDLEGYALSKWLSDNPTFPGESDILIDCNLTNGDREDG